MIANLMMYARPELAGAHRQYWALIRHHLAQADIDSPEELAQDAGEFPVWLAPDLVLSQTCGMPYRLWLHDRVALVGTPDFGLKDCPAGYYNSVIVTRAEESRAALTEFRDAVFAYNQTHSQSGYGAAFAHVRPLGFWFENRLHSGGHLASARAVAEGRADIASLDGVTWRLIRKYEPFAAQLKVLDTTTPTPGLPYITARTANRQAIFNAVQSALADLPDEAKTALGIKGLVAIPDSAYLAVPNPDGHAYPQPF